MIFPVLLQILRRPLSLVEVNVLYCVLMYLCVGIELDGQCMNLCTAGLQQADYYFVRMDCKTQDSNHRL